MLNIKTLLILSGLSIASFGYSQNFGPYPYYSGNPNQYQKQSEYYPQRYGQYDPHEYQCYPNRYSQNQYDQMKYYQDQQGYDESNNSNKKDKTSGWLGENDEKQQVSDNMIRSRVAQNIRSTPYFSPLTRSIQVEAKDGNVTLKGKAFNKNEGYQIEYMVKNVPGVKSVTNDLEYEK